MGAKAVTDRDGEGSVRIIHREKNDESLRNTSIRQMLGFNAAVLCCSCHDCLPGVCLADGEDGNRTSPESHALRCHRRQPMDGTGHIGQRG